MEAQFKRMWTFLKESNYEELGDISSDMKCIICSRILINAHSSTTCGCIYCLGCMQAYLDGEMRFCPGDMDDCQREVLEIGRNIHPDVAMNYRISKLVVQCRYSCGFRCELRDMEEHERACGRQSASCPYVNVGCTETRLVSDRINEHLVGGSGAHATLLMACIGRLQGELSAMKRQTGEMRSDMTNVRSENSLLRAEIERHRAAYRVLELTTEQQLAELRARLAAQEEKCGRHEKDLSELGRYLRLEKEEQERRLQEVRATVEMQHRGGFVWRVDGWAAKRQSAREGGQERVFSEAFYSHENGYRMRLSAWPDGYYGAGRGTHLAVYVHLVPGPFDNILSWPFRRAVTLSLIDQHTGRDHASDTVAFDDFPDDADWSKPTTERSAGFGTFELVELAALSADARLCRDDAIFIRCVVKDATME